MDRHAGELHRLAMTRVFCHCEELATKQSMQRPVAATPSVGRWGRNRFARQLAATLLSMDRHAGKLHRLAMTIEFVIARSAATKQSMQRVAAISSVGRSTTRLGVTGRCMDRHAGKLHRLAMANGGKGRLSLAARI